MSDKPLISFIVPVYKVERYLPRCIESILGQTYTNFELILVDDGTPDRSGIICDRYAEKDSRIRVIHKENGGVSTARNAGIDAAKGEWITFVDSDDWVSENYLQAHILPTFEYDYDFVISSIEIRGLKVIPSVLKTEGITYSQANIEYVVELISKPRFYGPFAKLYKAKILKVNNIKFPEGIKNGEDKIFVAEYLKYCKSMQTLNEVTYFYNRLNEGSVTQEFRYAKELPFWIENYLKAFCDVCDSYQLSDLRKNSMLSQIATAHLYTYVRNCGKCMRRKKSQIIISEAVFVLLPWIMLHDNCEKNTLLKNFSEDLRHGNMLGIYKVSRKNKYLRNLKQRIRMFRMKLLGDRIEKKRDNLIQ